MSESIAVQRPSTLLLSFNQDFECFSAGCDDGFRLYNTHPVKEIERCELGGGIAVAEMLFRSNYLALVGGGRRSAFPPNKLIVWDCSVGKAVIELEMEGRVLGARLRRDCIVVLEGGMITTYTFSDIPHQIAQWRCWPSEKALCSLSNSSEHPLIAFPSSSGAGWVEVRRLAKSLAESPDHWKLVKFKAHSHELQALAFNAYGTMVATASEKGTLVRVFDAMRGTILREFRRGSNPARISWWGY